MKIILSRKGFDSSVGKVASPIFPSGRLLSLPIPDAAGAYTYDEIRFVDEAGKDSTLGALVADLTRGRLTRTDTAHLDPDLRRENLARAPGWRPLFGQARAAQGHLQNQGVSVGDVLLFYGWFRQVEEVAGHRHYVNNAPDLHVIFGWMQIGAILPLDGECAVPAWATYHPHVQRAFGRNNTLYVAADDLTLSGQGRIAAGAGVFTHFAPALQLTTPSTPGHTNLRSVWRLPDYFFPHAEHPPLSYHADPKRWSRDKDGLLLCTVGRGQEFVLDCAHYPEVKSWLQRLMMHA